MKLTEEMLYKAAPQAAALYLATLPDRADCGHAFSPAFERKMRRLLPAGKGRRWRRFLLLAAAVAVLAAGVSGFAGRQDLYQVRFTQGEGILNYLVRANRDRPDQANQMALGYVPEGYAPVPGSDGASYRRGESWFTLRQLAQSEVTGMLLGDYLAEEAEIGGSPGVFIQEQNTAYGMLLWTNGAYILELTFQDVPQEEIWRIAGQVCWQRKGASS